MIIQFLALKHWKLTRCWSNSKQYLWVTNAGPALHPGKLVQPLVSVPSWKFQHTLMNVWSTFSYSSIRADLLITSGQDPKMLWLSNNILVHAKVPRLMFNSHSANSWVAFLWLIPSTAPDPNHVYQCHDKGQEPSKTPTSSISLD